MFAALILLGAPGAPNTGVLAITYDPPRRRPRVAPSSVREIVHIADVARLALAMAKSIGALPGDRS